MKKLLMTLGFAVATVLAVQAQETQQEQPTQTPDTEMSQDNRTEIQESELPEEVQTALQEGEYAEMEVSQVYEVTTDEGTEYEVVFSDGTSEQTVTFKEDGTKKEDQQ